MIHFSSRVAAPTSYEVDATLPGTMAKCLRCLLIAMDVNSVQDSTPAEERVIMSMVGWFRRLENDIRNGVSFRDPIFVYVNLNTGFVQVFVSTDAKGKITF